MTWTAGIDITFPYPKINPETVILSLLAHKWSLTATDSSSISYLPLGDNGMYNWQYADLAQWDDVQVSIRQQIQLGEHVGISLNYDDANVAFLFPEERNKIGTVFNSASRWKLVHADNATDWSRYLSVLLPPIVASCEPWESISCTDFP